MRFRTSRDYPTEEQARWRIIDLLEIGLRPRRIAPLLAIQPAVVYDWQRRLTACGLPGLTTRTREETAIPTRVSVQAMLEVFQRLDNTPLLGYSRVQMALDALGYRSGHTTVWQMVALYQQAHPQPPREPRLPNPDERPRQATAPHQVWCVDLRYLVQIEGQWLSSILDLCWLESGHRRRGRLRTTQSLADVAGLSSGPHPVGGSTGRGQ